MRYTAMSIPGREGEEAAWFVLDRSARRSTQAKSREEAIKTARAMNVIDEAERRMARDWARSQRAED